MADQSDVEAALVGAVGAALYPEGIAAPSIVGRVCRIYRGWPVPAALAADLASGHVNVSVFPEAAHQVATTRWPDDWAIPVVRTASLTTDVVDGVVTFGGAAAAGQLVGLLVDNLAVVHRTEAGDTPESVAAVLGAYVRTRRMASVSGATVAVPGATSVLARVVADQGAVRETRRQRQGFRISCWCADPATRDVAASRIDAALSSRRFIGLPDGMSGRMRFVSSAVLDQTQNAALYRRDLVYSVEYATTVATVMPSMIFGDATLAADGGGVARSRLS